MKRPTIVWITAICMIFSPLGNIIVNMYAQEWATPLSPTSWITFLKNVRTLDLIWLCALSTAGFSLLIRRRTTWIFALTLLSSILFLNIFRYLTTEAQFPTQFWIGIFLVSALMPIILYQMRYPYIERRESHFKANQRYAVNLSAILQISEEEHPAVVINISRSGALIELPSDSIEIKVGESCRTLINYKEIQGKVVRLAERAQFGMHFEKPLNLTESDLM